MPVQLVAVLGVGIVSPSAPIVRADDPGLTRGDGCFEGCRLRTSQAGVSAVDKLDLHLARMSRSAADLDIAFDEDGWRTLVATACSAWTVPGEAALKLVLTRGVDAPTGLLTIGPLPPDCARQRAEGVRVITLSRGYGPAAFEAAPWLLGGVKTLSYAVNMAAIREAERRGADDAILLATDGTVLETPTGSVVWTLGRTLRTIAPGASGILGSTTVELLFTRAAATGWRTERVMATVADLHAADAVWVISSVRGPVDVVELDGRARTRRPGLDGEIRRLVDF